MTFLLVMGKSVYCLLQVFFLFVLFSLGCSSKSDLSFAPRTLVHPLLPGSCFSPENQSLSLGKTNVTRHQICTSHAAKEMSVFVFISAGSPGEEDVKSSIYSVIMVGNSNVGKTSFMGRALNGRFSSDFSTSVGKTLFFLSNLADKSC